MAFTSRVRGVLGQSVRRIIWIGLLCLLAAALLSACDDEPQPAATEQPTDTPTPTNIPTSPPSNTPTPTVASEPTATPPTKEEKVLTILYWQAPSLPGPYLSAGTKDRDAGAITLEPLAKYDPDGDLVPALAAQIPTLENGGFSQDLMSITWNLKEGLKWSDGSDMTAHDVVFTWVYCVDEDTGCTASSAFTGIASVQALDNLTVKATFDAPMSYPYGAFVGFGTPIISRAQFADCVGAAAATCEAENTAPLGTGPYRITAFKTNEEAIYERNPFYRGESPYFDRVVLKGGGDAVAAIRTVLEMGEADYAWNLQVEPEILATMEAAGRGKVVVAFTSLVERIVVNQTNPVPELGDDRSEYLDGRNPHPFLTFTPIPKAMSMAIDRSLISEQLYGFAAEPTCNLVAGRRIMPRPQTRDAYPRTLKAPINCWTIMMCSIPTATASVNTTASLCGLPTRPRPTLSDRIRRCSFATGGGRLGLRPN